MRDEVAGTPLWWLGVDVRVDEGAAWLPQAFATSAKPSASVRLAIVGVTLTAVQSSVVTPSLFDNGDRLP